MEAIDTAPRFRSRSQGTLGRVFNLLGEPIDGRGEVHRDERWPIRRAPALDKLSSKVEVRDGNQVIDLLTPFVRGGRRDCSAGPGRKTVIPGTDRPHRDAHGGFRSSPASANERAKTTSAWNAGMKIGKTDRAVINRRRWSWPDE
jgi:F-type H+-transporting ATPase subunit beta